MSQLLVSQLQRKYSELLGDRLFSERAAENAEGVAEIDAAIARFDSRKAEIDEQLAAIETVIWLFEPKWDPAKVKPIRPKVRHLSQGAISRAAYATLREAQTPITTRQIAKSVALRLYGGKQEERTMARLEIAIYGVLSKRVGQEGAKKVYVQGMPHRWSIKPLGPEEAAPSDACENILSISSTLES